MGESNVSSGQPRLSGQPKSVDRPGPSKQTGTSAFGSGFAHETPPAGSFGADEGNMSLSDFIATEIYPTWLITMCTLVKAGGMLKATPVTERWNFFSTATLARSVKRVLRWSFVCSASRRRKALYAEEEIRSQEAFIASQESFAARLEAERVAEEARERAEHEALDLRN
ncbi:hypothetical protein LWI29_038412 [Acer saccharum]|uniref:Uncharacterized protein n=1 Tax=Acer saccharum TaxID=4024 RepID=A0AA39SH56_ACESA|nr:hypothetical protein LWI29_038412 [Acer saccharum]